MKHPLLFLVFGAIVVLSVTFASYVVLTAFHPEAEVRRMLLAMARVGTFKEKGGWSWTRDMEEGERVATTMYTIGQVSQADPTQYEHATRFRVVRLAESKKYADLSGEIRSLRDKTYLTYTPPGPSTPAFSFEQPETWVRFEEDQLPLWGPILPGMVLPIPAGSAGSPWTPEGMQKLRQLLARADVFLVGQDYQEDEVQGAKTWVVDAWIDPDAIRAFLRDLVRLRENREPTNEERLDVEAQARALQKLSLRFWIGKEDHRLYRLQADGAVEEPGSTKRTPVNVYLELSDFDAPFAAVRPPSPVAFSTIFQKAFGTLPPSTGGRLAASQTLLISNDTVRLPLQTGFGDGDGDGDGLDALLETFYGTDPRRADTDGDGVSDGDEVLSGKNPRGRGSLFGFGLGE